MPGGLLADVNLEKLHTPWCNGLEKAIAKVRGQLGKASQE